MYSVTVPLMIMLSKNKKYPLNLNHYRNAHFRENHKGKELFQQFIKPDLLALPKFSQVILFYKIYPARKSDVANIGSIVDKFFCDAMVETGRLEDDNLTVVKAVSYLVGEIDPKNPRVEVTIMPLETLNSNSENNPMKITIVQSEIEQAITNYINEQVNVRPGQKIEIDLAATRGSQGFTAEINISKETADVKVPMATISDNNVAAFESEVQIEVADEPEDRDSNEVFKSSALEDVEEAAEPAKPSLFSGLNRTK